MSADADPAPTRRAVDEAALRRTVARLQHMPQAPWLHREVARRMAERLAVVRLQPAVVVDWWPHLGGAADALAATYPKAHRVVVEPFAPQARPVPWWSPRRWTGAPAVLPEGDVPAGQAQLVWANMMLHAAPDPLRVLRGWQRALAVDGFLMFSTFGPGTLAQLREVYAANGWGAPMAPLVDMHDLGDMLVEAGFADPVMDQETLTLTWADATSALAELRSLGANADPARTPGLRTPRWRARLVEELTRCATQGRDGRIACSFEVVYGHAFKPLPRARIAPQTSLSVADLRAMARAGSPRRRP